MKTVKLKNVAPLIRLTITDEGGKVTKVVSRKKMKIVSKIVRDPGSELKIEVLYGYDITNSGTFRTKQEALQALSDWTEASLIKYIEEGEWEVPGN
jgi:hypothetical protein